MKNHIKRDHALNLLSRIVAKNSSFKIDMTKFGALLGFGDDGYVYDYDGRAFKFACENLYTATVAIQRIQRIYCNPNKYIVKIHSYNFYKENYWYEMDKLYPLSEKEYSIFYEIFINQDEVHSGFTSEWILHLDKKYRKSRQHRKMLKFLKRIRNLPITHLDLHGGNIMKDKAGNYKLIDVESIRHHKLTGHYLVNY